MPGWQGSDAGLLVSCSYLCSLSILPRHLLTTRKSLFHPSSSGVPVLGCTTAKENLSNLRLLVEELRSLSAI